MTFFGVPFTAWGVVCVAVAGVFVFLYPRYDWKKPPAKTRLLVLRWFHPLVWLLLAGACFLYDAGQSGYANFVAILAMPIYLFFITTVTTSRELARDPRKPKSRPSAQKKKGERSS